MQGETDLVMASEQQCHLMGKLQDECHILALSGCDIKMMDLHFGSVMCQLPCQFKLLYGFFACGRPYAVKEFKRGLVQSADILDGVFYGIRIGVVFRVFLYMQYKIPVIQRKYCDGL